ncbi:MAG TPA: hypothetical protein VLX90_17180, partial [Steroidobacteraceae bacterium]|nr:hypothetical protein [Steroidobacteraceae bacterium]
RSLAVLAVALCMTGFAASAATVVPPAVSGSVNAVGADQSLTVNGHRYLVAPGSAAASQLNNLHVGDVVGLIFDGPADSSGSHVIAIVGAAVSQ